MTTRWNWAFAVLALAASSPAVADEAAPLLRAPVLVAPKPQLATMFSLKLRLPEGRGIARVLLDAGVSRDDAAVAARLAAGHMGDGTGGCDVKVEISKAIDGPGFKLERVVLLSMTDRTVIERRHGELSVASQSAAGKLSNLI